MRPAAPPRRLQHDAPWDEAWARSCLEEFAAGNSNNLRAFIGLATPIIENSARRYLGRFISPDEEDVLDDAVQLTRIRIWNRAGTFDPAVHESVLHFVRKLTLHAASRAKFHSRHEREVVPTSEDMRRWYQDQPDPAPTPLEQVEQNDLTAEVHRAIDGLDPRGRYVVGGFYMRGQSYEQLADDLGMCRNTVRRALVSAKESLSEVLIDHRGDRCVVRSQRLDDQQKRMVRAHVTAVLLVNPHATLRQLAAEVEGKFGVRRALTHFYYEFVRPAREDLGIDAEAVKSSSNRRPLAVAA